MLCTGFACPTAAPSHSLPMTLSMSIARSFLRFLCTSTRMYGCMKSKRLGEYAHMLRSQEADRRRRSCCIRLTVFWLYLVALFSSASTPSD